MRTGAFGFAVAISATVFMAISDVGAAAAPSNEPPTVGRMKRIVLPPEGPVSQTVTTTRQPQSRSTTTATVSSAPAASNSTNLSNPADAAQKPVQDMINRALPLSRLGPAAPPGLQ